MNKPCNNRNIASGQDARTMRDQKPETFSASLKRQASWDGQERTSGKSTKDAQVAVEPTCRIIQAERTTGLHPTVDCYNLGKKLGRGRYGLVFAATTKSSKEKMAIKSIDLSNPEKFHRHMKKSIMESKIMSYHGNHPNIINLREVMYSSQSRMYYMVMPRASLDLFSLRFGRSKVCRQQPDILQQAMLGILSGVRHLHEHGVAHLDIKPENVLCFTSALDKKKNLIAGRRLDAKCFLLTDFGESRMSENYGACLEGGMNAAVPVEGIVGTLQYCAPEIVSGCCMDGRIADMWSIGVLLLHISGYPMAKFHCCAILIREGKPRKFNRVLGSLLKELNAARAGLESPCQRLVLSLVLDLLTIDPRKRVTASQALEHPWFQYQYPTVR